MKLLRIALVLTASSMLITACSAKPTGTCPSIKAIDNSLLFDQFDPNAKPNAIKGQFDQAVEDANSLNKAAPAELSSDASDFLDQMKALNSFAEKNDYDFKKIRETPQLLNQFNTLTDKLEKTGAKLDVYYTKNCK